MDHRARVKKTCYSEEYKQKKPCANVQCVEIAAMATATDAQPHTVTHKHINMLRYHTVLKGPYYPLPRSDLCVSISIAPRLHLDSDVNFCSMYLLNGTFYGYSRSHKLYFEQTNTSCMTEQTAYILFFHSPTQFNSARSSSQRQRSAQTSDFCFYRFDIIHDCFFFLVSLYKLLYILSLFTPLAISLGR